MFAAAACSANVNRPSTEPEPTPKSADEVAVDGVDEEYLAYVDSAALPFELPLGGGAKQTIVRKTEAFKAVLDRYKGYIASQDPIASAHAHWGVARGFLNFGCELATMKAPAGFGFEAEAALRASLDERAESMLQSAADAAAGGMSERGGTWGRLNSEIERTLRFRHSPLEACQQTERHWASAARPEVAPTPEITREYCDEQIEKTFAHAPECDEYAIAACDEGDAWSCVRYGVSIARRGDKPAARRSFEKGCSVRSLEACWAVHSVVVPADLSAYQQACASGDALGCLDAARVIDASASRAAVAACAQGPLHDRNKRRCLDGDSEACWAEAGALVAAKEIDFDGKAQRSALLGGLGMRGTGRPERDLRASCEAGNRGDCLTVARQLDEGGDSAATDWYRKSCDDAHPHGCHALGAHLAASKDGEVVREGVSVLVQNCLDRGSSSSCFEAAKLYAEGARIKRSRACAAGLAWSSCSPETHWACEDVNRVFHSKDTQ